MPDEPTGCASCTDCQCGKNERNQEVIDDNRLIRHQKSKFYQLAAMSMRPDLTASERYEISRLATKNALLLERLERG